MNADVSEVLGPSRREAATAEYLVVARLATEAGLALLRLSEAHYQLKGDGWVQNIYPGNQRLYYDRNQPSRPPYLNLPVDRDWSLTDVVTLTIAKLQRVAKKGRAT